MISAYCSGMVHSPFLMQSVLFGDHCPRRRTSGIKILPPGKSGSTCYFFKNSAGVIAGTEEPAKSLMFLVRI